MIDSKSYSKITACTALQGTFIIFAFSIFFLKPFAHLPHRGNKRAKAAKSWHFADVSMLVLLPSLQCVHLPHDVCIRTFPLRPCAAPMRDSVTAFIFKDPEGRFTHRTPCPCRAHAVPLPCHAAKGLECVFPI
jgi:hypothetical protein